MKTSRWGSIDPCLGSLPHRHQIFAGIQALAEGTREVSSGNFDYQVPEQSQDELGLLIRSFNAMTTQLRDSRAQIDQFTRNHQFFLYIRVTVPVANAKYAARIFSVPSFTIGAKTVEVFANRFA